MFNVGPMELLVILVLALLIFGPGKLPEVGEALGKAINEFRRAVRVGSEEITPARPASRLNPPAGQSSGASSAEDPLQQVARAEAGGAAHESQGQGPGEGS